MMDFSTRIWYHTLQTHFKKSKPDIGHSKVLQKLTDLKISVIFRALVSRNLSSFHKLKTVTTTASCLFGIKKMIESAAEAEVAAEAAHKQRQRVGGSGCA
jgi:hypothetical protein